MCNCERFRQRKILARMADIAQWIRLRLPFCSPAFESRAYHRCFAWSNIVLYLSLWCENDEINKKRPGFGLYLKKTITSLVNYVGRVMGYCLNPPPKHIKQKFNISISRQIWRVMPTPNVCSTTESETFGCDFDTWYHHHETTSQNCLQCIALATRCLYLFTDGAPDYLPTYEVSA